MLPEPVTPPGLLALVAIAAYGLGSVPFGILAARLWRLPDPRAIGSGNIGATNVLRAGNRAAALFTLVGDAGKGGAAVLIARALAGEDAAQLAGLAAFLGHLWPIWIGFRGGKGVATWLGTLLALAWPVGLAAAATWLATAVVTRISSLSALVAAASSPLWMLLLGRRDMVALGMLLAALIFLRHRANIARLLAGREPRIGRQR